MVKKGNYFRGSFRPGDPRHLAWGFWGTIPVQVPAYRYTVRVSYSTGWPPEALQCVSFSEHLNTTRATRWEPIDTCPFFNVVYLQRRWVQRWGIIEVYALVDILITDDPDRPPPYRMYAVGYQTIQGSDAPLICSGALDPPPWPGARPVGLVAYATEFDQLRPPVYPP